MVKYKDRKEQRKVTETMDSLLLPLLDHCNNDTATTIRRALYLLGHIDVESHERDND